MSVLAAAYRAFDGDAEAQVRDGRTLNRKRAFQRRKKQGEAAEELLSDLLEHELGLARSDWRLERTQSNKPIVVTAPEHRSISVSLSHSGNAVLAGVADLGNIGVDLERKTSRHSIREIAAYAFGPGERQLVSAGGFDAFYRIWTLREALAKATGQGFTTLVDGRDYFPETPSGTCWEDQIDGRQWLFSSGELLGTYSFSVALALRKGVRCAGIENLIPTRLD